MEIAVAGLTKLSTSVEEMARSNMVRQAEIEEKVAELQAISLAVNRGKDLAESLNFWGSTRRDATVVDLEKKLKLLESELETCRSHIALLESRLLYSDRLLADSFMDKLGVHFPEKCESVWCLTLCTVQFISDL